MSASTPSTDTAAIPKKRILRSEAQWRELVASFAQSTLTLEAYCRHHKIAQSGFYAWRKRFASESNQNSITETLIDITPQLAASPMATHSKKPSWQVELELGHGCVLRIKTT